MAHKIDPINFVLTSKSKGRSCLKRELELPFKSQTETSVSTDPTQCKQDQNAFQVSERRTSKRSRKSGSAKNENGVDVLNEEEADSDVFYFEGNDNNATQFDDVKTKVEATSIITTNTTISTKTRVKKSKAASSNSKKLPSKLKDLMASGILEGLNVKYIRRVKVQRPEYTELRGTITGNMIRCYCEMCKGGEVVRPTTFERHAGSSNKRPTEYILLHNGKSLRDILNIFLNSPQHNLEEYLQNALGDFIMQKSKLCLSCGDVDVVSKLFCNLCVQETEDNQHGRTQTIELSNNHVSPATQFGSPEEVVPPKSLSNGRKRKQRTPGEKSHKRATRKSQNLHKLCFKNEVLPEGAEVAYIAGGKKLLTGSKSENAILCKCCNSKVCPSKFETHAGCEALRQPYRHIYSKGVSLHRLSINALRNQKISTTDKDDLCSICNDGGDLLCCNGCTKSFHTGCVSLSCTPSDTWYCTNCESTFQKDKDEENDENVMAAERMASVDPLEETGERCVPDVDAHQVEQGGCALCRCQDFTTDFGPRTALICDQCERDYHVGCLKEHQGQRLEELPEGDWFCSSACERINNALRNLVVRNRGEDHLPKSLLSWIKNKHGKKGLASRFEIKWRVLNRKLITSDDCEAGQLLSKALAIFQERFDPIVDPSSGKDLISAMLKGESINGQDFGGMYCAVLTLNKDIVCAAIFRVFGEEVAELPLVATNKGWERQGYFRRLFSFIENMLGSLKVRQLVLPAAHEAASMWTNNFGFTNLDQDKIANYKAFYNLVMFQGTSLLSKSVPAPTSS